jgi:hypothetical protein
MKENIELGAFVLLIIGTLGLLMNEFIFAWGRPATLIFATANVIGLLAFGLTYWSNKRGTTSS